MTSYEFEKSYGEQVLEASERALARAVAAVSPENPDADPLQVFPAPNELRASDQGLNLTAQQESELRDAAAELGFGRETDLTLSDIGLRDSYAIIEGGQPHKVVAEAQLALQDPDYAPSVLFFSGSSRAINSPAEMGSAERLGVTADNEYEMICNVVRSLPGFVPSPHEIILPLSYDINNQFATGQDTSGQFVLVGAVGASDIMMMRIDRDDYSDHEGNSKYRNQPDSAAVINIIGDTLASNGDIESPIVLVTSSTYQASRSVDAARVSQQTGRPVGVATYGTAHLAAVKGESTPAPGPINQLPGELHKLAQQVDKLRKIVQQ